MKSMRFLSWLIVSLSLLVFYSVSLLAQSQGAGTIEGAVTDDTGAVVPGVRVVVRNVGTNAARDFVTNDRGRYQAVALQPGSYEISAEMPGFAKLTITNITLRVGATATVDLKLKVATVAENVTVSGEAPITEPDRIEVTSTVSQKQIDDLPINGRRWENFVLLTPGVSPDGNFGLVSYRGISGLYNNNTIDGADNNQAFFSEARGRTRISYTISQATVKEFQVGLSNFSAEFGRAAGGTVNAITKSGTNQFHGEGFYFLRDKVFQAKNPRVNARQDLTPDQKKPDERRQQFGASLGGPIRKDKLFFFGNYDQQKRNFPGFTLPIDPISPAQCTAPGCGATIAFLNSLVGQFPRRGDNYVALAKLDWMITQYHTLTTSYNYHKWNSPNGVQTQPTITASVLANGNDGVRTDMFNVRLTSILSQTTVNEFHFQYGRDFEFQFPNAPGPGVSYTNGISFGQPNFLPRPAFPNEKRFQFTDNYSFMRGSHSFKAGVDINYVRDLQINLLNGGGVYSYTGANPLNSLAQDCPAQAQGCMPEPTGATTGHHYSTFSQAFDLRGLAGRVFFPTTDWNFYFQDQYRIRPTLNLYLGLRYEFTQIPQPTEGNPLFPLTTRFNKDTNNFGPRFGFAWDIGGAHKTVLRGGYGMYYGRTSNSAIANALTNNGIRFQGYTLQSSAPGAPTFPNVLSAPPAAGASSRTIQFFSADYVRPLIHSVDLSLEREIVPGLAVSGSYLFSRGLRLPYFRDINLPRPTGTVTYILPDGTAAGTFPLYRGPRPDTSVGSQIISESVINSSYHGFVLAVTKRFSHGVQLSSNFTLAKAIDNGQSSATFFGGNAPYDPGNLRLEKGLSNFDVRKRWVTNFLLSPSVNAFTDRAGARAVLNNWKLSGILTFSDGRPVTGIIAGGVSSTFGLTQGFRTNGSGGDDRVPFIARNSYTGTGQATVDFRITRSFRVTEKTQFEFIWEAFNLFNRVNYTSFQLVQYAVDPSPAETRMIDDNNLRVKLADPSAPVLPSGVLRRDPFLTPVNVGNTLYGPREFQLGLKFIW